MRIYIILAFSLYVLIAGLCYGQEEDTTFILPPVDSALVIHGPDSLLASDTLTAAQKAMLQFQARRQEYQEERVERKPNFSFYDSLTTYYTSPRLNQRESLEQSFFHDAGDYFRFDPSFLVIDNQSTPLRKTVQPFGLSGGRLNVIANKLPIAPFEHVVEPDGLTDMNDIPIALDQDRYIMPGPAGLIFGGDQAVASLITLPKQPESNTAESSFLVDQGAFDYNHVRGKYSKLFSGSREIDLAVSYRNADGADFRRGDDVYHYVGRLFQPLGPDYGLNVSGQLYNREGSYVVRPDELTDGLTRDRIDRNAEISIDRHNPEHDRRSEIGYRYLRQGSNTNGEYKGRFDIGGYGLFVAHELIWDSFLYRGEVRGDKLNYTDGFDDFDRKSAEGTFNIMNMNDGWRYAATAGAKYVEDFDLLPVLSAALMLERSNLYVLFSVGYTERAPTLHELNLRFQRATIYADTIMNYAEQGNPNLKKEEQLVASATVEYGSLENNLRLSVTTGSIKNAIDWRHRDLVGVEGLPYTLFAPQNDEIAFTDLSLQQKLKLGDWLRLRSGGAYHIVDYRLLENKPYQPDYQVFSGLELHLYWPQKIMDLFAYGEITYVSEYEGYSEAGLGHELIGNVKLSFRIKDFRFHYVIQNVLSTEFQPRENMTNPGRYSYYGLTWDFRD